MSATLVRGLKVAKMPGIDGPVWSIGLLINDGSDFLQVYFYFLNENSSLKLGLAFLDKLFIKNRF